MFGLSVATEIFQGSTARTWNCVSHFLHLLWTKLSHIKQPIMPKSRKRHHSRSRSRSRSTSRDRSHEREDRHKKNDSHEKDREGKRRKIESYDSPAHKRSVSSEPECHDHEKLASPEKHVDVNEEGKDSVAINNETAEVEEVSDIGEEEKQVSKEKFQKQTLSVVLPKIEDIKCTYAKNIEADFEQQHSNVPSKQVEIKETISERDEKLDVENEKTQTKECAEEMEDSLIILDDSDDKIESNKESSILVKKNKLETTPKKVSGSKQLQKKMESEKKRKEKQLEKEERERKKNEERERVKQEKLKRKKEKEMKEEQKKKEREEKEEQRKKEREEKEQKRKEKEEREEQKRKEKEQEKLKKQLEFEEKNKEKQKEEEKKQKAAAAFVNFFVAKKCDSNQEDKRADITQPYAFMAFEVKSDMKLPPARRKPLSEKEKENLEQYIENQDSAASYIKELKLGKPIRKSLKTWPFEEVNDDDVTIVEDEGNLGETICEDKSKLQKFHAKLLKFHENRRPAYFGTWRKKSKCITPRKPFAEDKETFNYEEDSDDDWEEEEQGESLNGSDDEGDKENEEEKDDYEVDNEFFVPHGHLSEDEIDDEEKARLSPNSLKQKLKLLKDEFDQDMQSKTHRLKPRSIGCIWYNKDGSNVEEVILRYLQPLAMITKGQIQIKKRGEIFTSNVGRQSKAVKELNPEYIPMFLKVIHGNSNKKRVLVEQFMTYMANNDCVVDIKKTTLVKHLKRLAAWKKCADSGPMKNKFCWLVNEDVEKQYNADLSLPNFLESDTKK